MFKKIFAIVTVICIMPMMASAATLWKLGTRAMSQGGVIDSRNMTGQTVFNGSIFRTYTSATNATVTVTPNPGYKISKLSENGLISVPDAGTYTSTNTGTSNFSLQATFARLPFSITATAGSGGSVDKSSYPVVYSGVQSPVKSFIFTPNPGQFVSSIIVAGAGSVSQTLNAVTGALVTMPAAVGVKVKTNITTVGTASVTVTGAFGGTPAVTDPVSGASCQGCHDTQGVGPGIYANWSTSIHKTNKVMCYTCHIGTNTGGHPGTLNAGSVDPKSFDYNASGANFCSTCHSPAIVTDFEASGHVAPAGSASCSFCHTNAHNVNAACVNCHTPDNPYGLPWPPIGLEFHDAYTGTDLCTNCHNLHNPGIVSGMSDAAHYNNITSGKYPASYVTSRAECTNCHASNSLNATVRHQWAKSGHAAFKDPAWTDYDFKTKTDCVQCHSTTGFIAYSTGKVTAAWGVAADKTKELLTCIGCHSNVANGIVRTVTPVKPFADDTYVNRNVGPSNICMDCHSGRNNGLSITGKVGSADFAVLDFVAPHYLAAGGTLHGKGGYNYPDQTYAFYSSNSHRAIGIGNSNGTGTAGPCIGCHMTASEKHLFKAVSSATNGTIGKITAPVCVNCHADSLGVTQITTKQADFANTLEALKAMLADKGFVYTPTYPYFSNTNWGSGQSGANTMGAAFNYVLLLKEPGAYAHNSAYAKQLTSNSIDYLYNGNITGKIDTALAYLVSKDLITQTTADSATAFIKGSSCTDCHTNTSKSHPTHLSYNYGCNDCHYSTAISSSELVPGNVTHLNGLYDLEAGTGRSFNYASSGSTCSNISCHSNGTAVWGTTLGCDGCHGNPPDYTNGSPKANSHANHIFGCNTCHVSTTADGKTIADKSKHVNGVYDVAAGAGVTFTYSYAATGGTCSNISCHGNNSATWGSTLGCSDCHGYPPPPKAGNYTGVDETTSPHKKHAGADTNYSFACNECHKGNSHGTGTFQDVFINTSSTIAGSAATYATGTRTCSSLYCHGNGTSVATKQPPSGSVVWGSNTLGCNGCHGNPPAYANNSPKTNSHASHNFGCGSCHAGTTTDGSTIANKSLHVNGAYNVAPGAGVTFTYSYAATGGTCSNISCHGNNSATWGSTLGCSDCHGYPPPPKAGNYTGVDETTSPHKKHAGADTNYSFACNECHKGNSHGTGTFQDVFINTSSTIAGSAATYATGTRTCSSLYCHGNGTSVATKQPPSGSVVWGSNTLGCNGCHGNPPAYANNSPKTNSHASHNFGCGSCHAGTTTDGSTIANKSLHVNGAYNVAPGAGVSFTYSYAATGGTCSNISCHGNMNAVWGSSIVSHNVTPLGSGDVIVFTNETFDHGLPPVLIERNCIECHYENLMTQHNGNCALCHAGANPAGPLIGNWNHTCTPCHPTIHFRMGPNHNGVYDDGSSQSCSQCHNDSQEFPGPAEYCTDCHNPASIAGKVGQ